MTSAEFVRKRLGPASPTALAELISALTFALDLTEGATPGHGIRCCLLGMRIAQEIGIDEELRAPLYYALLLKDIGCSNNASRMTQVVGGDDRVVKGIAKITDWTSVIRSSNPRTIASLWRQILPGAPLLTRLSRMLSLAVHQRRNNRLMIELRCERGSQIVRKLEMGEAAAHAVYHLDEHWDGRGYPNGLRGQTIPLTSRICAVAQNLDIFASIDGVSAAHKTLHARAGTWFDPQLVAAADRLHARGQLWQHCAPGDSAETARQLVLQMAHIASAALTPVDVDTICEGFAEVVDAKSPFTYRHSQHVAEVAVALAKRLHLPPERQQMLRRAGLLHDLGKLSMPNTILDKAGPLTDPEWRLVRQHPLVTQSILERVAAFQELAVLAAEHHEKLDGTGYPNHLTAPDISLESRILALADQFAGMTERRSYHPGYDEVTALGLLRERVVAQIDSRCFAALEAYVHAGVHCLAATPDLMLELA